MMKKVILVSYGPPRNVFPSLVFDILKSGNVEWEWVSSLTFEAYLKRNTPSIVLFSAAGGNYASILDALYEKGVALPLVCFTRQLSFSERLRKFIHYRVFKEKTFAEDMNNALATCK